MPELWQRKVLLDLQEELSKLDLSAKDVLKHVIRISVAAGNGVGKTALMAMIIHWFASVFPHGEGVCTAGTGDQLSGKLWRELAKWQPLAINGWMMEWAPERYKVRGAQQTWFIEARTWSVANPDAMAGTHEKYVLMLFDEASAIDKIIWETVKGALTTGLCLFIAFGNPTTLEGGFWETQQGREAHRWHKYRVDAREVSFANHEEIQGWIDTYGADDDFVRVHVYGMFPKGSSLQFIDTARIHEAAARIIEWKHIPQQIPRLMGVDIARSVAGDLNTIVCRQGRKMHPKIWKWHSRDTMPTAQKIIEVYNEIRPDWVYIDGVGVGGGVIDYLRTVGMANCIVDVQSGVEPHDPTEKIRYGNMRSLMWERCNMWLQTADIPADQELQEELAAPKRKYMTKTDKILVESKEEMRARGVKSPNIADSLIYTFWTKIPVKANHQSFAEET
jgi:hypothetical protein